MKQPFSFDLCYKPDPVTDAVDFLMKVRPDFTMWLLEHSPSGYAGFSDEERAAEFRHYANLEAQGIHVIVGKTIAV